jgi:microcystin degradation protein MlrC
MSYRVLLAGLFHETHTFLDGVTPLSDWEIRRGEEMLAAEGDGSPLGGALSVARQMGWQVLPAIDLRATPSATAADEVVDLFCGELEAAAQRALADRLDGVYLVLHGAMVSQSHDDVEGEILARLRAVLRKRDIPLCGVLDLHCNYSARMAANSHALVAYRENPHTDAEESARRAAQLLDRLMRSGERPLTVFEQPPLVWPPTGVATADDPMRSLEAMAREIEAAHPEILAVNVFAGFSFADIHDCGVSFSAVTLGDPAAAQRELRRLADWAIAHKEQGNVVPPPIESVMPQVLAHREGPILLVEPADNIGGGAPGDATGVLRALLKHGVRNSAVVINDPAAAQHSHAANAGDRLTLSLGGKGRLSGGPVELNVELLSTSDGRFELEDRHSHLASMCGVHVDMGPCAVVRHNIGQDRIGPNGGVRILLTSRKTPPFDLGQLRSQGIVPERLAVIGVKAAVAHRRAYDPIAKASYTVDTPGPCSSNLRSFPFAKIRRPIFPLDENV